MKNKINSYLHCSTTTGIGTIIDNISNINKSYQTARKAQSQKLIKGSNNVFCYYELETKSKTKNNIDLKTEHEILNCFEICNYSDLAQIIDILYSSFRTSDYIDAESLSKFNLQLILIIFKALEQSHINAEKLLGNEFTLYNEVNSCTNIDSMTAWFKSKMEICLNSIRKINENPTNKLLQKATSYINQNIKNDLTLKMVADHVHISPNYLSKLFSEELSQTYREYVINKRIENAKILLKEGIYKINEVSSLVGFNDEKHFYKVFKKIVGITPGEYKKL
jgi:two-component system, response regulator YesN